MVALTEAAPNAQAAFWTKQLNREAQKHEKWRRCAEKTEAIYWDEYHKPVVYPILNNVVRIKHTALYSENPDVVVRRRNVDSPAFSHHIASAIERAILYQVDCHPMEPALHRAIDDLLITGLGHSRIRYKADTEMIADPMTGELIEQITDQKIWIEHVPWSQFRWEPQHTWDDVSWVAFDTYMTSKEVKKRFPDADHEAGNASDDAMRAHETSQGRVDDEALQGKICVTEIWHKPTKHIYVIAEGYGAPLEVRPDVLNLKQFFPCPAPMMANVRSRSLIPWPDYKFYQSGAETLNRLQARKINLQRQMKDTGFYDAQLKELAELERTKDGEHVPVSNLMERLAAAGAGDPRNMLVKMPIENTAGVLTKLDEQLNAEEQRIFRLTGINDLVLGATEQYETAEAQRIKANWAKIRLADIFDCVVQHMVTLYDLMAEIIVEHYEPDVIMRMTGVQIDPQQWAVVQDDHLRSYMIDIEHELSVAQDQMEMKVARNEAVQAMTQFASAAAPLVQQGAFTGDFAMQTLAFIARGFSEGRGLEDAIQQLPGTAAQIQQLQQTIQQGQQQMQQLQQENNDLKFRLSKFEEGEYVKDLAEAEKKQAEADKIAVETAQLADQAMVDVDAAMDEIVATQQARQAGDVMREPPPSTMQQ